MRARIVSSISILGLAIAFACCLLITLFILHELSYDRFHSDSDRIYRVCRVLTRPDGFGGMWASVGVPPGPLMQREISGIDEGARILRIRTAIRDGSDSRYENDFFYADPSFFRLFDFELSDGNKATPLNEPNSIVLTHSAADEYFPDQRPVGKQIELTDGTLLTVTALVNDPPTNSHIQFRMIAPLESYFSRVPSFRDHWDGPVWTYIKLISGVTPERVESCFPDFIKTHLGENRSESLSYFLQPLHDIHLSELPLGASIHVTRDIGKLYILGGIGILILAIAYFNFVNLSTALFTRRTSEMGIRKAAGAGRRDIVIQFLTEPVLIALIALVIAVVLAELLRPVFASIAGVSVSLDMLIHPLNIAVILFIAILVGIIAGLYPAATLSRANPIRNIQTETGTPGGGSKICTGLVTIQFTVSVILIVFAIVAYRQAGFLSNHDLGFESEGIVVVPTPRGVLWKKLDAIRTDCMASPHILNVSASSDIPAGSDCRGVTIRSPLKPEQMHFPALFVDRNYCELLGLKLIQGKRFSDVPTSRLDNSIIVNRKALSMLAQEDSSTMGLAIVEHDESVLPIEIIGVTEDFHFRYVRMPIQPLILRVDNYRLNYLLVRIDTHDIQNALNDIKNTMLRFSPDVPFEYFFLDNYTDELYSSERRFSRAFTYPCIAAILIACMGLFGLASIASIQRTREIGIRKTLGASVFSVVLLLTKRFAFPVIAGTIAAWSIAYILASRWLEGYLYRISFGVDILLLSGLISLFVAVIAVSYHSFRAATANPVKSLRSE